MAQKYKWPEEPGFSFNKYGKMEAIYLCLEWVRRSEYLFRMWLDQDEEDFEYPEDCFAGYEDALPFLTFMLDPNIKRVAYDRGMEIRLQRPKNPR